MAIYEQTDEGVVPIQIESTIEDLLLTREAAPAVSPCVKENLAALAAQPAAEVVTETPVVTATPVSSAPAGDNK
jgi:hypothetical protein